MVGLSNLGKYRFCMRKKHDVPLVFAYAISPTHSIVLKYNTQDGTVEHIKGTRDLVELLFSKSNEGSEDARIPDQEMYVLRATGVQGEKIFYEAEEGTSNYIEFQIHLDDIQRNFPAVQRDSDEEKKASEHDILGLADEDYQDRKVEIVVE